MKGIIALSLVLVACGSDGKDGTPGVDGNPGRNGKDGINGVDGKVGKNGVDGKSFTQSATELLKKISPLTKNVLDIECVSPGWRGTGTKTPNGAITTAAHVTEGCTNIRYYSEGVLVGVGGLYTTTFETGRDISRISSVVWNDIGKALPGIPESTSKFSPSVGDLTVTVSYPLDLAVDAQLTLGFVSDVSVKDIPFVWRYAFTTDAAAAAGSSGAPVFDSTGAFVGIHVGGYNTGGLELNFQLPLVPNPLL